MAKPSMIDAYLLDLNQSNFDDKIWRDKDIGNALDVETDKERARKDFDERLVLAQRPPRSRF